MGLRMTKHTESLGGSVNLHEALDFSLSDAFTGTRQNALSLVFQALRERFSSGEFRAALRPVWPEPLLYKSVAQEEIDEQMTAALASYRETGNAEDLAKWVDRYLEVSRKMDALRTGA